MQTAMAAAVASPSFPLPNLLVSEPLGDLLPPQRPSDSTPQQQSKEELLHQQVNYGNVDGIRTLRAQGAGLEWIDKDGKTPLMVASMRPDLLNVAKVMIELGANVNAYRPGSHAGTALHHAAKIGLEQTVHLLLSHGANPFITNDNCNTALEVAREKGHVNVVRAIEDGRYPRTWSYFQNLKAKTSPIVINIGDTSRGRSSIRSHSSSPRYSRSCSRSSSPDDYTSYCGHSLV